MTIGDTQNSRRNRADFVTDSEYVAQVVEQFFESLQSDRRQSGREATKDHHAKFKRHIELVILDLYSAWDGDPTKYVGYGITNTRLIHRALLGEGCFA